MGRTWIVSDIPLAGENAMFRNVLQLIVEQAWRMVLSLDSEDARQALLAILAGLPPSLAVKLAIAFIQSGAWQLIFEYLKRQMAAVAVAGAAAGSMEVLTDADLEAGMAEEFAAIEGSVTQ
jgi:hypothetical protein